jgi:hypothetical protein
MRDEIVAELRRVIEAEAGLTDNAARVAGRRSPLRAAPFA